MSRTAYLARTAHDLDHVNRLRTATFRIAALYIEAGGKKSKTHFAPGTPAAKNQTNDGDDRFHFAPGPQLDPDSWAPDASKTDKAKIVYHIDDPAGAVQKATLELFVRFKEVAVWKKELVKPGELAHGKDLTVKFGDGEKGDEWDGKIADASKDDFPDEYLTAAHAPYKLKITLTGDGFSDAKVAWTYFHVLVAKLEFEYGPKETLPPTEAGKADHRKTLKLLTDQGEKPPADGQKVKVYLESNVFKTSSAQMFDNSLFDKYKTLWGDGAQIPLFVKVWVKDSQDNDVPAPRALGKLRFLWDWESRSELPGKTFVDSALDYDKEATKPKGYNCHKERGGKRADDGKAVFPARTGYEPKDELDDGKFPFKVEACPEPRKWAAVSYAWTDKKLAAKTGVAFQPARICGDVYRVSVYVAYDTDKDGKMKINTDKEPPLLVQDQLKLKSGDFEIWRKQFMRKYLRKKNAVTALNIAAILGEYRDAFVDIEDVTGGAKTMDAATWNDAVENERSSWGAINQLFIKPKADLDQHATGTYGVHFRTRAEFITEWQYVRIRDNLVGRSMSAADAETVARAGANTGAAQAKTAAAGLGYSNAAWQTAVDSEVTAGRNYVTTYMNNPANGLQNNDKYATRMEDECLSILKKIFNDRFDAGDGVTIFQTESTHNLRHHQSSFTMGLACDFPNATERRCGFLLVMKPNDVNCGPEKISGHEIGHHFHLPHPPDTAERQDYKAHDQDHKDANGNNCLMSYNYNSAMELCGFCQLRLRGWDKSKLDPDGSKNKKP